MAWKKLGMVFDLKQHNIGWLKSHAMLPTLLLLDNRIRVYFTGRDINGHSRISFVDLKREDPSSIMYVHDRPLLEVGKLGTFDDSGTLGVFAIKNGSDVYLYYNGYNRRVLVPWSNAVGLAISKDNGRTFEKMFEGPIFDRTAQEPYFTITPCILRDNSLWHMWYTCGTGWIKVKDVPEPLYVIKYAYSEDGFVWKRHNVTCIQPLSPEEANARAAVLKDADTYKMWFTYRGSQDFRDGADSYRIGYAEADDPVNWTRDDQKAGIVCGPEEWDSKMQAYPAVVEVNGEKYLFYNGNGFGVDGFGCAIWEE